MKKRLVFIFLLFFIQNTANLCNAQPTVLDVTVKAHDAKFIGSAVGGLKITIRDFFTEKLLAAGNIEGETGDTEVIMESPVTRGKILSSGKDTARFRCSFDINEPVKLLVEVTGPMAAGLDIHKETKTTWLIPGRDITGDGILFELYGLIIHAYSPKPHGFYLPGQKIVKGVHVTPMCGCPVRPDFKLWNADTYQVTASVFYKDKKVAQIPLRYADRISHFRGEFTPEETGSYKVIITGSDKRNNQGVAITGFVVIPEKKYHKILGK
jgi:hypothetical protein